MATGASGGVRPRTPRYEVHHKNSTGKYPPARQSTTVTPSDGGDADEVDAFFDGILRRIVDPPREVTRAEKRSRRRARAREGARGGVGRRPRGARQETAAVPETPPTPEHPSRALARPKRRAMVDVRRRVRARNLRGRPVALHLHLEHRPERAPRPRDATSGIDTRPLRPRRRRRGRRPPRARLIAGWRGGGTARLRARARASRRRRRRRATAKTRARADEESLPWPPPRRAPSSNPPLPRRRPERSRNHRSRNDAENTDPAGVRTRPRAFDDGIDVDRRPGTSRLARTPRRPAGPPWPSGGGDGLGNTSPRRDARRAALGTCGAAEDATRPFQRGARCPRANELAKALGESSGDDERRRRRRELGVAPCARWRISAWYAARRDEPTTRASQLAIRRPLVRGRPASTRSRRSRGAACAAADWETRPTLRARGRQRGRAPRAARAIGDERGGEREGSDASLRFMTTSIARGS